MTLELIGAGFLLLVLLFALFKFRKPINRIADHCDNAVKEWCDEMEEGHRERTLEHMREFLDKKEYVPSGVLLDRMRCHDRENRYYSIADDNEKLEQTYMMEDLYIAMTLKERQGKIRDIISVIEKTGEWPKTTGEIYEIMKIEFPAKKRDGKK